MKLLLCTLIFLVSIHEAGRSQSQFSYGPRIGTSYSSFLTSRGSVTGGLGLVVGALGEYSVSKSFQVIANLDYHQIRAGTQYSSINGGTFSFTTNAMTIHTAEASGLIGYRIPGSLLGSAVIRPVGGGSAAYNIYASNTRSSYLNGSLISSANSEAITNSIAQWLYAVQAGIQLEFPLGEGSLSAAVFDFRYRRNMNPVLNGLTVQGTGSASDIYAESYCMTFGIKIN